MYIVIFLILIYRSYKKLNFNHLDDRRNEGNFRATLKFRAKGDDYLKTVLEGPGKRNKYISPGIQNQIIEACNKIILKKIVDKVNMSECFFCDGR